jgi:hypothetical protein
MPFLLRHTRRRVSGVYLQQVVDTMRLFEVLHVTCFFFEGFFFFPGAHARPRCALGL